MRIGVVVNPRAGGGAAAGKTAEVRRALQAAGHTCELAETTGPGDATRLAGEARAFGAECLVVVGGDGTLNEVCQAYVEGEGRPVSGPDLALVPAGTGGDFRRTWGIPTDPRAAVDRLLRARPRAVDLGWAEFESHRGEPIGRAFANVLSFGIGGLTDRVVATGPKWWGGKAAFFFGTLRAMVTYRNAPVVVEVDGRTELAAPVLNVALANGRYFGGGMLIAPEADPADGELDVVAMMDLSRAQGIALARKIYRGTHVGSPGVRVARGAMIRARAARPGDEVLIDLDGETPGRLPLQVRVIPGAIQLRA